MPVKFDNCGLFDEHRRQDRVGVDGFNWSQKISDLVTFVINGVRGGCMRTGNRGTSTWAGEPEILPGSDH